jgi:hypothetical protein
MYAIGHFALPADPGDLFLLPKQFLDQGKKRTVLRKVQSL